MSKYFYNGIDIGNIVSYGPDITDSTEGYIDFPGKKQTPGTNETININVYTNIGSSILAKNRIAQYYDYNNSGTINMPFNGVNRMIIFITGSGGGGGGSGNTFGPNNVKRTGGSGGQGGLPSGGVYRINKNANVNTYNITIGTGGEIGNRTLNTGNTGGTGNVTNFTHSNSNITVNGGNGGNGGVQGTSTLYGGAGTYGNIGSIITSALTTQLNSLVLPSTTWCYNGPGGSANNTKPAQGSGGGSNVTNSEITSLGVNIENWPQNTFINYGCGATTPTRNDTTQFSPGLPGLNGYVRIYFLFN